MKAISLFVTISIIILTLFSAMSSPGVHKPFLLTSPDFKIQGLSYRPKDLQSYKMFKLGDVKHEHKITLENKSVIVPEEVKIIPSDFIQQTNPALNTQTPPVQSPQSNQAQQAPDDSDEYLAKVEQMLNTAFGSTEPTQMTPERRAEMIAWNKWRSDLQNTIMKKSEVDAPYGTVIYFIFNVDTSRHIKNIKIYSTNPDVSDAITSVRSTIIRLNGDKILTFPKGTKRKSVTFAGGFLLGDVEHLSTPSDYQDFEYIQY